MICGSKEACLLEEGGRYYIFYDSSLPKTKNRFSLSHELGHYFLNHDMRNNLADINPDLYRKQEMEANFFSAQLLMPDQLLIEIIRRGYKLSVFYLTQAFQVSKEAAQKRMETLRKRRDENEIRHNIFMNRWLGVQWQNLGCRVIPCISWADESTYDICFSGVEKGCIVVISTLGVKKKTELFFNGFFEMKKRLESTLIIVFGDYIKGMTGRFLFCNYTESFSKDEEFADKTLFDLPRIIEIPEMEGGN